MEQKNSETTDQGFWWLPSSPETQLVGTITFAPRSGLKLDLVGSLIAVEKTPVSWGNFNVWGITVRGKPVSLIKAYQSSLQTHMPGSPTSRIEASRGIIGGHYQSIEDVAVHTLNVEFDYLTAWAGQTGISQVHDNQNKSSQIVVAPPSSIALGDFNGIQIELVPWVNHSFSREKVTLQDRCGLRLKSEHARSFLDFEPLISSFRTLLTFAVGEPAHTGRVVGHTEDKITEIQGSPLWREVEIIRELKVLSTKRKIQSENMLFTLRDSLPTPASASDRFRGTEQKLKAVFDLFFPTYFYPDMAPPQQFLNLVHATEAFHRATVGGQYQDDQQYENGLKKRLQKALPADLPEEFRQSLDTKFKFLHQYSLRKRLRDILRKFESLVAPYIPDRGVFVESVAEARNSLVHASADRLLPNYIELWKLAQQLGLI